LTSLGTAEIAPSPDDTFVELLLGVGPCARVARVADDLLDEGDAEAGPAVATG
jgi:hypothetical protein